jgi:hypothetical protein
MGRGLVRHSEHSRMDPCLGQQGHMCSWAVCASCGVLTSSPGNEDWAFISGLRLPGWVPLAKSLPSEPQFLQASRKSAVPEPCQASLEFLSLGGRGPGGLRCGGGIAGPHRASVTSVCHRAWEMSVSSSSCNLLAQHNRPHLPKLLGVDNWSRSEPWHD